MLPSRSLHLHLHLHLHQSRRIRMSSSDYLTATQVARRWGLHPDTLRRWRESGKGPAYFRTPGFVLYPLAEVEQYEKANTINPEEQR